MEMKEIFVPLLEWLIGGSRIGGTYNQYFGSCGTDPMKGAVGNKIFNYTIYIEKIDETEYIRAAVYFGMKSFKNCEPEEIETETFELEENSLPIIKAWIEEKRKEYFAQS